MIIFHQGLPRSGKSYEAVITILAELKKGRQVFTNIDGINFEKFSQLSGIPLDKLKGDIFEVEISESQVNEFQDVYSRVYTIAEDTPVCPKCGKLMQLKKARDFKRDKELVDLPNEFWGCMAFPLCRGTKPRAQITKYYVTKFSGSLFQLTKEDIPVIYSRVTNNSTVVIDEIQDFFPAVAKPLDKQMTEFITQHGHRGINLLLMGQDHNDCHNLFKRRIDKLIHFTKRDAVGMPNSYSWESYKLSLKGLVKLRSGSGKYDSKYFGLYKSHVDDSIDASNHQDDRANVFKSAAFITYIPAFFLLVGFAIYYLYGFFHSTPVNAATIPAKNITSQALPDTAKNSSVSAVSSQSVSSQAPDHAVPVQIIPASIKSAPVQIQYVYELQQKYKFKLAGLAYGQKIIDDKPIEFLAGFIDVLDTGNRLQEKFLLQDLAAMGWLVGRVQYGIFLQYQDIKILVRQTPKDYFGQVASNVRYSSEISGKK